MMRRMSIIAALVLCSPAVAQDIRPSFNCSRASFPDERAICADDKLAQLDQAASIALGQVPKDMRSDARKSADDQLKQRHACGGNRVCILDTQVQELEMLDGYGPKVPTPPWVGSYRLTLLERQHARFVDKLPTIVGTCTKTKISGIATRFGEELKRPEKDGTDAGTSVDFADSGHVVSYSFDEAVAASAIGDDIALCLVSIPKDCPPGDDRGRFYSVTNLRTHGSWIMPDSQHMCGGA